MPKFERKVRKIVQLLGLKWAPIAGMFSDSPIESGDRERRLKVCEAFDVVRREKVIVNLSKENCVCSGGRHFTGLELLPQEEIVPVLASKGHKVYESLEVALVSVRKQPQPVQRGAFFVLGPLESFKVNPDLVFLFVNPAQADRILGLVSFRGAEPFMYYAASSICSTITNALAKGKPEINFISFFERQGSKWSPNELIIALPFKDFETAVENISASGFGTA
ncbi:MAG TPA: DUF169 domain-containing protein [Candidatus Bathyarchaeia archaeon]|jgi:uncharacterized protein (DUF169 family)|nr:DUF169 domain-containing protein [Candidatus Bathyarchaeia archaeon]